MQTLLTKILDLCNKGIAPETISAHLDTLECLDNTKDMEIDKLKIKLLELLQAWEVLPKGTPLSLERFLPYDEICSTVLEFRLKVGWTKLIQILNNEKIFVKVEGSGIETFFFLVIGNYPIPLRLKIDKSVVTAIRAIKYP